MYIVCVCREDTLVQKKECWYFSQNFHKNKLCTLCVMHMSGGGHRYTHVHDCTFERDTVHVEDTQVR